MKLVRMWLLMLAVLVTLAGCGTIGSPVKGKYEFDAAERAGVVALSTRLTDQCGRVGGFTASIFKREEGTATGTPVIFKNFLVTPDIGTNGYFHVIELPEGEYTMGNVSVTGFTLAARHANNPEMISLKVESGRVVYMGEIGFTVGPGCGSVVPEVRNEWVRDATLFSTRVTNIPASAVKVELGKVIPPSR